MKGRRVLCLCSSPLFQACQEVQFANHKERLTAWSSLPHCVLKLLFRLVKQTHNDTISKNNSSKTANTAVNYSHVVFIFFWYRDIVRYSKILYDLCNIYKIIWSYIVVFLCGTNTKTLCLHWFSSLFCIFLLMTGYKTEKPITFGVIIVKHSATCLEVPNLNISNLASELNLQWMVAW